MEKPVKRGHHLVACPGEAHSNAFIDNCGLCAPRWGWIEIPREFKTLEAYRDAQAAKREKAEALKTHAKIMPSQPMPIDEVFHYIAQGAINITEGHTTIEAGSRVHRAMEDLCFYVQQGELKAKGGKR